MVDVYENINFLLLFLWGCISMRVIGLLTTNAYGFFNMTPRGHEIFQKIRSHTFFEVFKQQRQASFEKAKINVHLSWMEKDCTSCHIWKILHQENTFHSEKRKITSVFNSTRRKHSPCSMHPRSSTSRVA